jgi:hypothetical protein
MWVIPRINSFTLSAISSFQHKFYQKIIYFRLVPDTFMTRVKLAPSCLALIIVFILFKFRDEKRNEQTRDDIAMNFLDIVDFNKLFGCDKWHSESQGFWTLYIARYSKN